MVNFIRVPLPVCVHELLTICPINIFIINIAVRQGHHTRLLVKAAGDGEELVVFEEERSGVTGAFSVTLRAELVVTEAESAAKSAGLAVHTFIIYRS